MKKKRKKDEAKSKHMDKTAYLLSIEANQSAYNLNRSIESGRVSVV